MSHRERPFLDRLRRFDEVLKEISAGFGDTHRLIPMLDVHPPRVVSVAIQAADGASPAAPPTVYVPANDRTDVAPRGREALRRRIDTAIQTAGSQLSLDDSVRPRRRRGGS